MSGATGLARRARRRERADRGSSTLEFTFISVALLLLVFFIVQAALYYHARNVVKAMAEGTARAVRAYPAEAGTSVRTALPDVPRTNEIARREALHQWQILDGGGKSTTRPDVRTARPGLNQVTVTVTAYPIRLLPGLFGPRDLEISATAGGPFEVFKRSGED
jgi:Flp pilus assembly protein TadG